MTVQNSKLARLIISKSVFAGFLLAMIIGFAGIGVSKAQTSTAKSNAINYLLTGLQAGLDDAPAISVPEKGSVFIFGGESNIVSRQNDILEFDTRSNKLSTKKSELPFTSIGGLAGAYNPSDKKIYLFGGYNSTPPAGSGAWKSEVSNQILVYDPFNDTITKLPYTLESARYGASVVWSATHGKFFIFGGSSDKSNNIVDKDIIDFFPLSGRTTTLAFKLPYLVNGSMSAVISPKKDSKAYLFGGPNSMYASDSGPKTKDGIIEFDMKTEQSIVLSDKLPDEITNSKAALNPRDSKIYITSGYLYQNIDYNRSIYVFDPAPVVGSSIGLAEEKLDFGLLKPGIASADNAIYLFGGYDKNNTVQKTIVNITPSELTITNNKKTCDNPEPLSFFNFYSEPKIDEGGSTIYYPSDYNKNNYDPYGATQNIGVRYSLPDSNAKYTMEKKIGNNDWVVVKDLEYRSDTSSYIYVEKIPNDKNIKEYQFRVKAQTKDCKIAYSNIIKRTPNPFQWRIDSFKANRDKTSGIVALSWNIKNAISSTANPQKVNYALYRTGQNGITSKIYSSDASGSSTNPTGLFSDISTNKFESYSYQLKIFYPKEGITSASKIVESDYIAIEQTSGKDIIKVNALVAPPPPPQPLKPEITSFNADKLNIISGEESVTLSWTTRNAPFASLVTTSDIGGVLPMSATVPAHTLSTPTVRMRKSIRPQNK